MHACMHASWSWRLRQRSIIWTGMVTSINSIDQLYVATELCHVTKLWRFPEARRVVEDCHECLPLYTNNLGSCCDTYLMPRRVLEEKLREVPRRYHRRLPLPYKRRSQGAEERASADTQPQPPRASESPGRTRSWSLLFLVVVVVVTLYSTVKYQSVRCAEGLEGITFLPLCIIIRGFPKGKTICKLYCGNEVVSCFPWSF